MPNEVDALFAGTFFAGSSPALQARMPSVRVAICDPKDPAAELPAAKMLVPLMSRIDGSVMDRVPGLRLIQQWGAGIEGVDIPAATERRIAVAKIPTVESGNASSVAEWCVLVALALGRRLPEWQSVMANGTSWGSLAGSTISGKRVGILGYGGIGQILARRLAAFDATVVAATRTPDRQDTDRRWVDQIVSMDQFDQFLSSVDYLFLTLPLTPDTRFLINADALAKMKPTAYLINAGRGPLVDPDALIAAVDANQIAGAALDVFVQEPLDPTSPLITHPKILVSPHIGGATDLFYLAAADHLARALESIAKNEPLEFAVNWSDISDGFYR